MSFIRGLVSAAGGFLTGGIPGAVVGLAGSLSASRQQKTQDRAVSSAQNQAQQGIDAQVQAQREGLAASLAGQQTSYDLMRHQEQQQMPWRQASLGALQTLPVLQQALGLPSYQIPDTIQGMPEVNFMQNFNQALQQYGDGALTGQGGIESMPEGMRVTAPAPSSTGTVQQGQTTRLQEAPQDLFNMEASPLYQWQKKEVSETLRNQLAAQGLGQSTYAHREESRMRESLSAHERERQVRDMMQMVSIGMGGSPQASGAEMMPAQAGAGVAQSMANIGAIQGHGAMGLAQMGINAAHQQASQQPAWMQGLQMAGMFGNMPGGTFGVTPPTFPTSGMPKAQSAMNQSLGMMGVPVPIFH